MNALEAIVIERIKDGGPLSVAQYMDLALSHPEHGYYTKHDPFGVAGDFITAPEISQMFGELLGLWAAVLWQGMDGGDGGPEHIHLVELGPGRGTLMRDMLRTTAALPGFEQALDVHLVETSPALRAIQEETLKDAATARPIRWHGTFDDVPEGPLIVVANEFFDALPVEQYFRAGEYWCPRVVDCTADGDALCFVLLPPYEQVELPPGLQDAPPNSVVEVCPSGLDICESIARRIAKDGGAALIVDYGHARSAPGETLQAVKSHAYHDILTDPGEADLTAHVDFGALAQRVFASGARAFGPLAQGDFLIRLGINERAAALKAGGATAQQAEDIDAALERLTGPEQMGTLFKVMAIAPLDAPPPPVFE